MMMEEGGIVQVNSGVGGRTPVIAEATNGADDKINGGAGASVTSAAASSTRSGDGGGRVLEVPEMRGQIFWPPVPSRPPVQQFGYCYNYNLALHFQQQNGYYYQNVGPPPSMDWNNHGHQGAAEASGGVSSDNSGFILEGAPPPLYIPTVGVGVQNASLMHASHTDGPSKTRETVGQSAAGVEGNSEMFSKKVFVGGLPPDIDTGEITASFRRFGPLFVDWPHKGEIKSHFPPKGYAFLLFQEEISVQLLIDACLQDNGKLFVCLSSPTVQFKPVEIRPWKLSNADFVLDASMPLDHRKTVFIGGVPRSLKASELAMRMDQLYGGVCYAGVDTDAEYNYPKGAGRVTFSNQQSYIAAISDRFVQIQNGPFDKKLEVKPYLLMDKLCSECGGSRCGGKSAPFFCPNISCLQYYCEHCWATIHSRPGREYHQPLVKEGPDRSSALRFRPNYYRR